MKRINKQFLVGLVAVALSATAFGVAADGRHGRHHDRGDRESRGLTKRFYNHDHRDRFDWWNLKRDHRRKHRDVYRYDYGRRYWRYPSRPYYRYNWRRHGDDDLLWFGLGFTLPYLLDDRFDD
ncbi:MAG: hypothetical protein ABW116_04310 [Candidatus Sedimenticola sp. 20ELBAFRAG]